MNIFSGNSTNCNGIYSLNYKVIIMYLPVSHGIGHCVITFRVVCLQVTRILTPRRAAIVVVTFFIVLIASVAPIYYVNRFAMVFNAAKNKTILAIVQTDDRWDIIKVSLTVNNVVIPFGAFAVVIVCTTILIVNLHRKTTWRKSVVVGSSENLMIRDQKVSKMILMISSVFIICFIPCCVGCVAMTLEPRIDMYGQYSNTFIVIFGASFILESANSSVNIFVYYNMSSKFRATFKDLLRVNGDEQQKEHKQINKHSAKLASTVNFVQL